MIKPKHDDGIPSVRWLHGKPHLTEDERLKDVEGRADATITDVRGLARMLQEDIKKRKEFEKAIRERTHDHASALTVMTADIAGIHKAIGPDFDKRGSIHDMTADEIAALEGAGMRGQLRALMATILEERNARRAGQTALAKAQGRSASLLGALVVVLTAAQETGALRAMAEALRALFGG